MSCHVIHVMFSMSGAMQLPLQTITRILSTDELRCRDENQVFDLVSSWVGQNWRGAMGSECSLWRVLRVPWLDGSRVIQLESCAGLPSDVLRAFMSVTAADRLGGDTQPVDVAGESSLAIPSLRPRSHYPRYSTGVGESSLSYSHGVILRGPVPRPQRRVIGLCSRRIEAGGVVVATQDQKTHFVSLSHGELAITPLHANPHSATINCCALVPLHDAGKSPPSRTTSPPTISHHSFAVTSKTNTGNSEGRDFLFIFCGPTITRPSGSMPAQP